MKERSCPRTRILLADDHRATLLAVESFLKTAYNVVGACTDAQSLIEAIEKLSPDVALVDIAMPGMNGL